MKFLVRRSDADIQEVLDHGDYLDSRKAGWFAIGRGSEVIADIQRVGRGRKWVRLDQALDYVNPQAPHHVRGFRPSARTGKNNTRAVDALCLISGHEGQEIPGLVSLDRVVVD